VLRESGERERDKGERDKGERDKGERDKGERDTSLTRQRRETSFFAALEDARQGHSNSANHLTVFAVCVCVLAELEIKDDDVLVRFR